MRFSVCGSGLLMLNSGGSVVVCSDVCEVMLKLLCVCLCSVWVMLCVSSMLSLLLFRCI